MKIKILYLSLIFFLFLYFESNAQKFYEGLRTDNKTMTTSAIYYSDLSFIFQNIYYTKYVICTSPASDTIYIVELNFNKNIDIIEIKQEDRLHNQTSSKTIKFQALSYFTKQSDAKPFYCVKNYKFNDTILSLTDKNLDILFTIADTTSPKIFLNQINSINGNYNFSLIKLRNVYLAPHRIHAQDYWEWYKTDSIKRAQDSVLLEQNRLKYSSIQADIDEEFIKIQSDKDTLIVKLTETRLSFNLSKTTADENLQKLFALKMDTICLHYLGKICNINTEAIVTLKIISPYNHQLPIEIFRNLYPDTLNISWLNNRIDSIETEIKRFAFENKKAEVSPIDPFTIVNNKHLARCEKLKLDMIDINLSFDSVFTPILQTVKDDPELQQFSDQKIERTTIYNYSFTYKSKSETQTWFLKNKIITDSNDTLIIDKDNKAFFNKKFPNAKNGKYTVRLNTAVLNDSTIGPDLDFVIRKYKFISQVGFNVGTFITNGKLEAGNDTYDGKLSFWNVFLIYHHYGLFGGKSFANNTILDDYYEYGIYLAPGNYFYFKLGLAKYNGMNFSNKIQPIIGASLIFPVFQIEGGYNFSLKYPYIMIGFNIPFNI